MAAKKSFTSRVVFMSASNVVGPLPGRMTEPVNIPSGKGQRAQQKQRLLSEGEKKKKKAPEFTAMLIFTVHSANKRARQTTYLL